jgi:hypothetical protein
MNKNLQKRIEKFLSVRVNSDGGGWAPVTDEELNELYKIFQGIIDDKYQRDCDGDSPVNFVLANRNKEYLPSFQPVPYGHEDFEGYFDRTMFNSGVASRAFETAYSQFVARRTGNKS